MISQGKPSVTLVDILNNVSESYILSYYLGITDIPCTISSPFREDRHPSFRIFSFDGNRIYYKDFSTKEKGSLFNLLEKLWHCSFKEVLYRINNDIIVKQNMPVKKYNKQCNIRGLHSPNNKVDLQCTIREWRPYDIEYWKSYGITLEWLKYAEVYPVAYKIIVKGDKRYVFNADKYAYAYVEHKEGKVTLKIYQPFNKNGYKWCNKHDRSVLSLWTKVPKQGDKICICSSLKDALCLWANTGIPAIALQGEGYSMSKTAINELKKRFKNVYILLDNDKAGLKDAVSLAETTGFKNIVLPQFNTGKDLSDFYRIKGRTEFKTLIEPLFNP